MLRSVLCFLFIILQVYCDTNCPAGYSNRDTTHCYKVYTTSKSKSDAAAQCESEGGYLSSISNGFDNSYVYSLGQNASVPLMWLGIECNSTTKSSCFNDDETGFGPYDNFYPGNPSIVGNCVYISNKNPTGAYWFSFDCDSTLPFLCDYGSQCQSGYTKYHGSCYRVSTTPAAEVDAELDCQKDCGHLASIHSDKENYFVANFSAAAISNSYLVRIGLQQLNQNQLAWTDHTRLNYTNYGYVDSNTSACFGLSLIDRLVKKGQWSSENCNSHLPYVCKQEYSPGYPGLFGYNPQCVYFITTTTGSAVQLLFSQLQIVPNATISFYNDMADEKPFATIDSSSINNSSYKSTGNEMVLVFSYPSNGPGGIWEFIYGPTAIEPCMAGYIFFEGLCYKVDQLAILAKPYGYWNWISLTCPNVTTGGDISSCVWNDGTRVTYNGFRSGYPLTDMGWTCVVSYSGDGTWQNVPCDNEFFPICQTPLVVV